MFHREKTKQRFAEKNERKWERVSQQQLLEKRIYFYIAFDKTKSSNFFPSAFPSWEE